MADGCLFPIAKIFDLCYYSSYKILLRQITRYDSKMDEKTVKELLDYGTERLSSHDISTAKLDAEILLAHALNRDRTWLYIESDKKVSNEIESSYHALIGERLSHIPIAHLVGHKEFMSLDFCVNASVLTPRPETEFLVELVCNSQSDSNSILELGTGSGAIAVSIAKYRPKCKILATDISMDALVVARKNAINNGVLKSIYFIQTNLFDGISSEAKFDWVVSNPPYITEDDNLPDEVRKYEPSIALYGGKDGLDIIRQIIGKAFRFLKKGGRLAIEIGYGQSEGVRKIADEIGEYDSYEFIKDYANIPRIFYCSLKI